MNCHFFKKKDPIEVIKDIVKKAEGGKFHQKTYVKKKSLLDSNYKYFYEKYCGFKNIPSYTQPNKSFHHFNLNHIFKNTSSFRYMQFASQMYTLDLINQPLTHYFGNFFNQVCGRAHAPFAISFISSAISGCLEKPIELPMNVVSNHINKIKKSTRQMWSEETTDFYRNLSFDTAINVVGATSSFMTYWYLFKKYQKNNQVSVKDEMKINFSAAFVNALTTYPLVLLQQGRAHLNLDKIKMTSCLEVMGTLMKKQNMFSMCKSVFFKTVTLAATMLIIEEAAKKIKEI